MKTTPSASRLSTKKVGVVVLMTASMALGTAVLGSVSASASTVARTSRRPATTVISLSTLVFKRLNTIRGSFHLSTGQVTLAYASNVLEGVQSNEDPPFTRLTGGIVGEDSLWGLIPVSSATPLESILTVVNGWVYHDGWEGSSAQTWNADCTSANASGCNGHRRSVLSTAPVAGAKLYIDVTTRRVTYANSPALAVSALLVWKMPSGS